MAERRAARGGCGSRSEALSLRWLDLDFERGTLDLDENKTDDPRVWALDPSVARALELWRGLVQGDERDDAKANRPVFPLTRISGAAPATGRAGALRR